MSRLAPVALLFAGLSTLAWAGPAPIEKPAPIDKPAAAAPAYRLSGPHTHDNLTIFLIHGAETLKGAEFLTLDEALEQKKVVVHETKNVGELAIENVGDKPVFIQAGDIVKGGQQDRTLRNDRVIAPKSGRLPLASFCVEQGRWAKRGGEDARAFSSSKNTLNDNRLKLAARGDASQQEVWKNVQRTQMALEKQLKAEVKGKASESSLQLTLEHKAVVAAVEAARKKLSAAPGSADDVIGYAVVINGKVNNADVYGNTSLFKKLWPKLLEASAIEAISAKKDGAKVEAVKPEAVTAWLADAEKGKLTERQAPAGGKEVMTDNDKSALFDTKAEKGESLRRSYIAK